MKAAYGPAPDGRSLARLAGSFRGCRATRRFSEGIRPLHGVVSLFSEGPLPPCVTQGQATDIEIHAREILALRARLNEIYVLHTGQPLDVIEASMDRDKFLSPEEAKEFGIIDEIVVHRPVPEDEGKRGNGKGADKTVDG